MATPELHVPHAIAQKAFRKGEVTIVFGKDLPSPIAWKWGTEVDLVSGDLRVPMMVERTYSVRTGSNPPIMENARLVSVDEQPEFQFMDVPLEQVQQ